MTYKLPLFATLAISVQMIMGGVIVGKDAGFVCPDWPLCYHQVFPSLTNPLVLLELTHRFSALAVTVLVGWTVISLWRYHRRHRLLWRLAMLASASLLLQIVVGGFIVLFHLPGVVTTVDVVNSVLLLSWFTTLTAAVYCMRSGRKNTFPVAASGQAQLQLSAQAVFAATLLAVLVGALFRHTGASQALFGQNSYLLSHGQHTPPSLAWSRGALVAHIVTGVTLFGASLWNLVRVGRVPGIRLLGFLHMGVVLGQMVLGMWSLNTALALIPVTLHWGGAAGLTALAAVMRFAVRDAGAGPIHTTTERFSLGEPGVVH